MTYRVGKKNCKLCDGVAVARGLCRSHYNHHWKAGTLENFAVATPYEGFVAKIRKTNNCWEWIGTHNDYGYGVFLLPGGKPVRAHRFAYETWVGPLSAEDIVLHACDNPQCVNPAHLSKGTKLDNYRDAVSKRRHQHGQTHWAAKLSKEQVERILIDNRPQWLIAKDYGVHQSQISKIKRRIQRTLG